MRFACTLFAHKLFLSLLAVLGLSFIGLSQRDSLYQEIEEVLVTSEQKKNIVFEDSKYYIVDFTLSEKNALLLLKNRGEYYVHMLDDDMKPIQKLLIEQNASALFEDCFGNTYLVAKDSVFFISEDSLTLTLTDSQPRAEFMASMQKCVGSTSDKIIFEEYTEQYQFHEFYAVDMYNGDRKTIYEINDSIQARSLHDAARDLYSNGVTLDEMLKSAEVSAETMSSGAGDLEEVKNYREMNARKDRIMFFESTVVVQQYNPLFIVHDTLYFFNHFEGRVDQMDASGKMLSSIQIDHQLNPGWGDQIYMDIADKQFYGLSIEDGIFKLTRISLNGEDDDFTATITEHAHPKKVLIRNGYVYYTFKSTIDANLNKLYRQKL